MIYLETERLFIRDHKIEDLQSHHELMSDDKVMYYLQDIKSHSLEDSKKNMEDAIQDIDNPMRTKYFLWIEDKVTKEHIGEIGYTVEAFTPVGKLVHLGYYSFDKFWGHRFMTEALTEVIRFAFEENEVYRITTGCLAENIGSEAVMRKCGMIKEAEHKDWEWLVGEMKTRVEYRLLRNEYTEGGHRYEGLNHRKYDGNAERFI